MSVGRHCRHCAGACSGDCLLPGDSGLCIHRPLPRLPLRIRLRMIGTQRFWRRLLWGPGPGPGSS